MVALSITFGLASATSWLVAGLGLLVVLNGLGVSITPMLTALGVGGLAVALALQEPLANFFAGLKRLHLRFAQEGIVIPFPIRTLARLS